MFSGFHPEAYWEVAVKEETIEDTGIGPSASSMMNGDHDDRSTSVLEVVDESSHQEDEEDGDGHSNGWQSASADEENNVAMQVRWLSS
jgi:hypothetical protein